MGQGVTAEDTALWKAPFIASPSFQETASYSSLKEKAKHALDLSSEGVISAERIAKYQASSCGYTLLYGFERVDDAILADLEALAAERRVVDQMRMMVEGYPINWIEGFPSESRAVLHTAMRAGVEEKKTPSGAGQAVQSAHFELSKLQNLMSEIEKRRVPFDTMLFVGIGGSELGPHAIVEALSPYWKAGRRVLYAGNVDPDELTHALDSITPETTLVIIVSKSGTTLETATNEARVREFFKEKNIDPRDHFIAVTCPGTPMDSESDYMACLHLFDYVGGRYSTSSMVGGIIISFLAGFSVFQQFLEGARAIDKTILSSSLETNLPLLMALLGVWNRNFLDYPTAAIIPYATGLHRFPAHLQQCDMESNGKSCLRTGQRVSFATGPIVWGEPGTNAQHSFFQLLHQGTDIVPVEFIGYTQSQRGKDFEFRGTTSHEKLLANLFAQALALSQGKKSDIPHKSFSGNRPSRILLSDRLTPYRLGSLLALYEHKVAFQGYIWGINSFDQEGVQLGKVLADRILTHIQAKKTGDKNMPSLTPVEEALSNIITNSQ